MLTREWAAARKLLCIRLDAMGDVLMTGPAIRALKQSQPGRKITLLTSPAGALAAGLMPEIDDIVVYQAPWMKPEPTGPGADAEMIERLQRERFDAAVIFTVFSQNPLPAALMAYLANVPLRLAHCRENPYHLLTDWVPETDGVHGIRHEVQRQLDLVATIGCRPDSTHLCVELGRAAEQRAQQALEEAGLETRAPWLVAHPGASAASRRYPAEQFAGACRTLARDDGVQIVFTGSGTDADLVAEVQAAMQAPSISLAGKLSIEESAAIIRRAPLLLSNNTGVVHFAAATGTPTVVLYALTNPQHTPWQVESRVLSEMVPCSYCYKSVCPEGHHACLRGIPPMRVVQAVRELLGPTSDGIGPKPGTSATRIQR